jgi:hypothetical protein
LDKNKGRAFMPQMPKESEKKQGVKILSPSQIRPKKFGLFHFML